MCDIPMDLQRRFERRWAARFSGPAKEHRLEEQQQQQRATAPHQGRTPNRQSGEREPGARARGGADTLKKAATGVNQRRLNQDDG